MNRPNIAIENYDDLKMIIRGMASLFENLSLAFDKLGELGFNAATDVRKAARDDMQRCCLIMLALSDSFITKHSQECNNPDECQVFETLDHLETHYVIILRKLEDERRQVESGEIIALSANEQLEHVINVIAEEFRKEIDEL